MAQGMTKGIVGVVAGVLVAAVLIGALLPTAVGFVNSPEETTETVGVSNTTNVAGDLNATLTAVNDGVNATVELSEDTYTESQTIAVGENATYSAPDGDVNVTVESASATDATLTFEYPTTYGWGAAETALFGLMPLLFVLIPFIALVAWVYKVM